MVCEIVGSSSLMILVDLYDGGIQYRLMNLEDLSEYRDWYSQERWLDAVALRNTREHRLTPVFSDWRRNDI